jgi:hypothetical protein
VLRDHDCATLGDIYGAIKADIDAALAGKPSHVRRYRLSLTEWRDGDYAELVKTPLGKTAPLRNEFDQSRSYDALKGSEDAVPWA